MTPVPDAVAAHRLNYWTWLEQHAAEPDRTRLLVLRDHWRHLNVTYFDGKMVEPYITLSAPSKPSLFGQCCAVSSWGSRLEIRIRPSLLTGTHPEVRGELEGRWRFALDVLLHEAAHQYHQEVTGYTESSYHGHGSVFTATANRIGAVLGLPPVVAKNRGGSRLPKAAQWPHCVTPAGHYLGVYHPRVPSTGDRHCRTCSCASGPDG